MKVPEKKNEILNVFMNGPSLLEKSISDLTDKELDFRPSNDGWSIREIIHHVTDGDDLWKMGIKMALGNDEAEFNLSWYLAMPQMDWAKRWQYEKRSISTSLNLFKTNREHLLQLLESITDSWTTIIKYKDPTGKIELIPIGFVIEMQANHVAHHIKRIVEIRKEILQIANQTT